MPNEDYGFVYALENKSFPGYIKVGQTKNLKQRLLQFNNTGIPDGKPTLLLFAAFLNNYKKAERILHRALSDKRESSSKEFFKATYNQVKAEFELLIFNDSNAELIRPEKYNSLITGKTYIVSKRQIGSRPNRTFQYLSIPAGAQLTFKEDSSIKVTVIDKKIMSYVAVEKNILCRELLFVAMTFFMTSLSNSKVKTGMGLRGLNTKILSFQTSSQWLIRN